MNESDPRLLSGALVRALAWHGAQKRKGTDVPYASHLLQVAGLVLDHGGNAEQAAAALLHDAIEDCDGVDEAMVRTEFGERVARIVSSCTDTLEGDTAEKKSPWSVRKRAYLAHLDETLPARLTNELRGLLAEYDVLAARPGRCMEREITRPVRECRPDGRLDPEAVGWSRRPLHTCNLRGAPLRRKRWDSWCVTTDTHLLSMTYADLGVVGLVNAWFLEYAPRRIVERAVRVPFARGFSQPDTVGGASISFARGDFRVDVVEESGGTRLRLAFDTPRGALDADVFVALPPRHETLSVLVPFSERRFQFTSKHNTRPAKGRVRIGPEEHAFGPANHAFGCLDYGRGIWPWRCAWNWASASGVCAGRTVGLNLGGKWTDGTGSTENGLCLDGRVHKISEDLVWEYDRADWMAPWRIRTPVSSRVDLRFTPFFHKPSRLELGLVRNELHLLFGRFEGMLVDDDGEAVPVSNLVGWAEEHRARW